MSDIFISYARTDRGFAERLSAALAAKGWSVWWDIDLVPGGEFSKSIEREIGEARCVVVIWSKSSVERDWVRAEAAEGAKRNVLVPVIIEQDAKIPLEFRRIQAADLSRWNRNDSPEWLLFLSALRQKLDIPASDKGEAQPRTAARGALVRTLKRSAVVVVVVLVLLLALAEFGTFMAKTDGLIVETYFDQSVAGIVVGTPLLLKGVRIGAVTEVTFAGVYYEHGPGVGYQYVLVRMRLDNVMSRQSFANLAGAIGKGVQAGERVRFVRDPAIPGGYLELITVNPPPAPLPIDWAPDNVYLPSVPQ